MFETALLIVAGLFVLALLLLGVIFVLARWKPEALEGPLNLMRRSAWLRKHIDRASVRAMAAHTDTLLEELPGPAKKTLQRSLQGRSEAERAELLEEVQQLAEAGRMEEAARALQTRKGDKRQKNKAVAKRRKKNKAARRQRKKR